MACSHDTILAVFMALLEQSEITQADWTAMMEGVFVWFDESDKAFESYNVSIVWRGEVFRKKIVDFNSMES